VRHLSLGPDQFTNISGANAQGKNQIETVLRFSVPMRVAPSFFASSTQNQNTYFYFANFVLTNLRSLTSAQATTTNVLIFRSNAGSLTVTISNAAPAVVTGNGHGLAIGNKVKFTTTGALPSPLVAGTEYFVISAGFTANAFQISQTSGGAAINTTTAGTGTHTLLQGDILTDALAVSAGRLGFLDTAPAGVLTFSAEL
jgi:hypothetical protein